jgi:ankyrin repeat domain-containing protein 17
MAVFKKGHVEIVEWMVKHVNQFPSNQELSRYISTVQDKVSIFYYWKFIHFSFDLID